MIEKPTVLILGAGASAHLQYPTGVDLAKQIVTRLRKEKNRIELKAAGCTIGEITQFLNEFNAAGKLSVDEFLEHRPELIKVGRLAIAQALIRFENMDILCSVTGPDNNWYQYLYRKMNAPFEQFSKNALSVVTFNYDRSLEQYLYTALKNSYGKDQQSVVEQLESIPIVHVYGQICKLPWQDPDGRDYNTTQHPDSVKQSAAGIKIVHEGETADTFERAKELIEAADSIIFLGFQYHEVNMQRLGEEWKQSEKDVIGSCYGFTELEVADLMRKYKSRLQLRGADQIALKFLRENVSLI